MRNMSIFTVFFCGTSADGMNIGKNNSVYPEGELVATLAYNHSSRSEEFVSWILVDGPGASPYQREMQWEKPNAYESWTGVSFGTGWEENVKHAMLVLEGKRPGDKEWERKKITEEQFNQLVKAGIIDPEQFKVSKPGYLWGEYTSYEYPERLVTPQKLQEQLIKIKRGSTKVTEVNIVGWSRGGVSCIMLANAMAKDPDLKTVKVRILAFDPVPGPSNFQDHRTKLPGNVQEYVGFYARDERSLGFTPVVPEFSSLTKITILPMPGRHATLVGNPADDGDGLKSGSKSLTAPGKVTRYLAETLLERWGTKLDRKLSLTPKEMADLYKTMQNDSGKYQKMQSVYYTSAPDSKGSERVVAAPKTLGGNGFSTTSWSTIMSAIKGDSLVQKDGLSPIGEFLSWHHKEVAEGRIGI